MFKNLLKKKIYLIAEIGVNHCGDISLAKKMVIAAKKNGADAVKFQTFNTEKFVKLGTPKVKYQKKYKKNESHFEMLKKLEFSKKNHIHIIRLCKKLNIDFISTPYDIDSIKFLRKIGCKIFKISSADIVDYSLNYYAARNNLTTIISSGMSNMKEINKCLKIYKKFKNNKIAILHCVSNYPCTHDSINMSCLNIFKKKKLLYGYSDHSINNHASIIAVALGAKIIEKHFTVSKKLKGPDQKTSITPKELYKLRNDIDLAFKILGKAKKKCQIEENEMKKVSRKSIVAKETIKKGQIIKFNNITFKRPGTGIYPIDFKKIIGKKTKKIIQKDQIIKNSYLI